MDYLKAKFISGMSNTDYHALKQFVSSSMLKKLESGKTPAHLKFMIDHGSTKTKSMEKGSNSHDNLSNPIEFWATVLEIPEKMNRNSNDYKEIVAENPNKTILKPSESQVYRDMKDAILANKTAHALLSGDGKAELSCFFTDPETGLHCKIRPDYLPGGAIISEYKTTKDASPEAFKKQIINMGYDIQSAFYPHGMEVLTGTPHRFIFIAQETTPPYLIAIYEAWEEVLTLGMIKVRRHMRTIHECQTTNNWPGYPDEIQIINLPAWAKAA